MCLMCLKHAQMCAVFQVMQVLGVLCGLGDGRSFWEMLHASPHLVHKPPTNTSAGEETEEIRIWPSSEWEMRAVANETGPRGGGGGEGRS